MSAADTRAASALKALLDAPDTARRRRRSSRGSWQLAAALGVRHRAAAGAHRRGHGACGRCARGGGRCGAAVVPWFDAGYPRCSARSPIRRSCSGSRATSTACATPAVAIVGSRRATPAGLAMARRLGRRLARAGLDGRERAGPGRRRGGPPRGARGGRPHRRGARVRRGRGVSAGAPGAGRAGARAGRDRQRVPAGHAAARAPLPAPKPHHQRPCPGPSSSSRPARRAGRSSPRGWRWSRAGTCWRFPGMSLPAGIGDATRS